VKNEAGTSAAAKNHRPGANVRQQISTLLETPHGRAESPPASSPSRIKFSTYTIILPLILLQAAGWRRPLRSRWLIGLPFGTALGILYSVTTISGPPLAILFNNQGLVKNEFRAGLALVRVAESSVTAIVYLHLGLFVVESQNLLSVIIPSVVVGIPLGAYVIRRLDAETFRRICMSFDAWIVGFGLSRVLIELNLMETPWAYGVMAVTILIDIYLLYIFFSKKSGVSATTSAGSAGTPRSEWSA
jgi:uncharacterized protein